MSKTLEAIKNAKQKESSESSESAKHSGISESSFAPSKDKAGASSFSKDLTSLEHINSKF